MNYSDPQEIERIIEKLDNLLMEGHLKHVTLRQNYFQTKNKNNFNLDSYKKELSKTLDEWFRIVM